MAQVMALVHAGDRGASRAVGDAGKAIGRAVAATVNLVNPRLVVIGGDLSQAGDVLLDPIRSAIDEDSLVPAATTVRSSPAASGSGPRSWAPRASSSPARREALARRLARTA